mgnify:CR=1 FL=1
MDIKESIESVRRQFRSDSDPFPSDKDSLENLKIKFLGRKGLIANLFSQIPNLSNDQKPIAGKLLNQLKIELSSFSLIKNKDNQKLRTNWKIGVFPDRDTGDVRYQFYIVISVVLFQRKKNIYLSNYRRTCLLRHQEILC